MTIVVPERFPRSGPAPSETLARLMALRGALGITRIADITGLDRLGIPVMQAVRPFSLSNAVSQGKGKDATTAAISAILESAETYFAERVECFEGTVASANALDVPGGRFDDHLLQGTGPGWRDEETMWVAATDLLSGRSELVPRELVHTAYVDPPLPYDGHFAASTSGLAASLAEEDALVHGILEVIERDAIVRAERTHGFFQRQRIDLQTIDQPGLLDLLDVLRSKGMFVGLWHALSPFGLPVVWCQLMESGNEGTALLPYPADGSAAGFHLAGAAVQAIYEAAQVRVGAISGARDDITRASYPKYPDRAWIEAHRRMFADGPCPINFRAASERKIECGDKLAALLSALSKCNASSVLAVRIDTAPAPELVVVKVLIPGLQPMLHG